MVESPCDVNEQTGQCEYDQEARISDPGKREEGKEGEWGGNRRKYFHVPGDVSADVCPVGPEYKTCLLVSLPGILHVLSAAGISVMSVHS